MMTGVTKKPLTTRLLNVDPLRFLLRGPVAGEAGDHIAADVLYNSLDPQSDLAQEDETRTSIVLCASGRLWHCVNTLEPAL